MNRQSNAARQLSRVFFALILAVAALIAAPTASAATPADVIVTAQGAPININTASAAELTKLKGIGKGKAKAIVEYRTQNGPFASVDDLTKIKGIGKKTVAKFRDQITVGDGDAVAEAPADAGAETPAEVDAGAETPAEVDAGADAPLPTAAADDSGKLNINTASAAELTELKGIGKGKAKAIVEYRTQNGPFTSVDDLTKVKGIGKKTVAKFRDQITVGAPPAE